MNVSAQIVSREPANLATLPLELIYAICVQALVAAKPLPPTEPRYVWRQGRSAEIAIACRYREWTLSLRLICRTMNVVLEPLVLTRLTLNRDDILSGASGMHEMLETIASGSVSPIAKYTKSLFIGSLRDMTSVADTDDSDMEEFKDLTHPGDDETYGDDEDEEVGDEGEDEENPSSDGSWHGMGPQIHVAFSDVGDVEDVAAEDDPANFPDDDAETILQLASLIRDALIKFTALESFKWNIRAASYKTHVFAAVTEALSTLPSLSEVAFSIHPERFDFPALPAFPHTKSLSLCIYGLGNYRRGLTLSNLISTMAKTLPAFPAVENLQVHHYDSKSYEEGQTDPTIKNVLSYCSPEHAPPLKSLDLLNVPFVVDDTTMPFLRRLETLSISFMTELDEAVASTGALPPDRNGSTSLRSLTIYGYFGNTAFSIIPLSGLRHLSLLEMSDRDDDGSPFTRATFDLLLPGHVETLESLAVLPTLQNSQSWTYDDSMVALIARCRKLQHLAVTITVGRYRLADASIVKKVVASVARLDQPLCTLAIDIYDPDHNTHPAKYGEPRPVVIKGLIKQLESIVISDSETTDANPHQYPSFIRINERDASYRLGRSGEGDIRYIWMKRDEVENLVSTLPGGENTRLW